MKILYNIVLIVFIAQAVSCKKEKDDSVVFHPTEHAISKLGSKMRLVIFVPGLGNTIYNFSSVDSLLTCEGSLCEDYLVPVSEMNELAKNLSDTTIFQIITNHF